MWSCVTLENHHQFRNVLCRISSSSSFFILSSSFCLSSFLITLSQYSFGLLSNTVRPCLFSISGTFALRLKSFWLNARVSKLRNSWSVFCTNSYFCFFSSFEARAFFYSKTSGTLLIVTIPRVSLSLLSGDIFLFPKAIVPASCSVLSLPASVLSFMLLSSLLVCSCRTSSGTLL